MEDYVNEDEIKNNEKVVKERHLSDGQLIYAYFMILICTIIFLGYSTVKYCQSPISLMFTGIVMLISSFILLYTSFQFTDEEYKYTTVIISVIAIIVSFILCWRFLVFYEVDF